MKKLISVLMVCLFFWQALPLNVLAEAVNPPPTAQELAAAVALTGLSDDAPGYHPGMEVSTGMNVQQLVGWIDDFWANRMYGVMDSFENYDVALHGLKESHPAVYQSLEGAPGTGVDLFYTGYQSAMEMQDEIKYYRDTLSSDAADIFTMAELLQSGACTEKEQAVYACEIREKWRTLEQLTSRVKEWTTDWQIRCRQYEHLFMGISGPGDEESVTWLMDEIDKARGGEDTAANRTMTVSAGAVRVAPDQTVMTRLARLSLFPTALADESETMSVTILDDTSIAIGALDGRQILSGVTVNAAAEDGTAQTKTTGNSGYVLFPMRFFPSDRDGEAKVNLSLSKDGYRRVEAPGIWIKKGAVFKVPMRRDDGTPYPVSWTFWGNDLTLSEYELVLSPFNDGEQDISMKIASGKDYSLKIYFTDKDGNNPLNVGQASGKAGEQTFTFSGQWLKNAQGDGKLFAEITPQGGEKITCQAKIKLIAPAVKKPMGDPAFKLSMTPGLQFRLPDDWVTPLGGLTIAINTPLDEVFQVRAFFDLNGNGAITVGTTAFDGMVKDINDGLWKSKDKKALDKAVKDAEEKGLKAKAKAANGGDWEGRKKYNPLKLGKINVSMSWFAFAQVQYRETKDDYGQIFGKGGAGFTVTVNGEVGLQWPLVNLSLTASLAATIFPDIGVMIDVYWPSGQVLPKVQSLDYVKGSLNIIIRLELALTLCVGLKYVFTVSITGLGFLEFQFRKTLGFDIDRWIKDQTNGNASGTYKDEDVQIAVYGGAAFKVVLEVVWSKTTYTPFGPEWKWQLYPGPVKRAEKPETPVDRFLADLALSANAEETAGNTESIGKQQGGMQVDTGNQDLLLEASEINYLSKDTSRHALFTMRLSGGGGADPVPMMMFLKPSYNNGEDFRFDRPVAVAVNLSGRQRYSPIAKTEEGLDAGGKGVFTDGGFDVIDYSYWVQDVSGANLTSYDGGTEKTLTDVLFVVTVLAKEYEEQTKTYPDGTQAVFRVPLKTWAYVHCYYLGEDGGGYALRPVVLTENGGYLAELYEFTGGHNEKYSNPCGNPAIYGNIMRSQGSVVTLFRVMASPLNVTTEGYRDANCCQILTAAREDGRYFSVTERVDRTDAFFEKRAFDDFIFYDVQDNSREYDGIPSKYLVGYSAEYYTLVRDRDETGGLYSLGFYNSSGDTAVYATNVAAIAPRRMADESPEMIFIVQQSDTGEGFVLKSLNPAMSLTEKAWTESDYDVSVPNTDIYWATIYGRECVYWVETAGRTEDGEEQLFRVRGMWYDSVSNTLSNPFVLATLKAAPGCAPVQIVLNGRDSGYYLLSHTDGRTTAHRFSFKLVPGINLVSNLLTETLAAPGTYDDMLLVVYNNGNVPLSGLDLVAYDRKDGRADAFETIHLDVLHPYNNRVTLKQGLKGAVEEKQGVTVARQEESSLNGDNTQYWLVKETKRRTRISNVLSEETRLRKTELIMPGMFAAFNISLLLPQSWENTHDIYLQVDRIYTTAGNSFSTDANAPSLLHAAVGPDVVSVGRDGTVRKENAGGMLMFALMKNAGDTEDYAAMYKTDLTFDGISLSDETEDLEILSRRWEFSDGTPMVTLTVNNQGYIASGSRRSNVVIMEAYLDEETAPVFRYSLPEEVSDTETWSFDLPLSLLTDGRSAGKVTVKVGGKNYIENGEFDNSTVIYLAPETLLFLEQPQDQTAPEGGEAVFRAAASGGRAPLRFQWQAKTPKGSWTDVTGETGAALTVKAAALDMDGNQYRVIVTDAAGSSITSRAAALTVKKIPRTGDDAPVFWWMIGAALALAGIAWAAAQRKKERHEKAL